MRPLLLFLLWPFAGLGPFADAHAQTPAPAEVGGCNQDQCGCAQSVLTARDKPSCMAQSEPAENSPGIQDNSFLVEEAYNQESGVVQHIQTFQRLWNSKDWGYTFTQEWPVDPRPRHQLSYTLVFLHAGQYSGSGAGVSDVLVNYRYQMVGSGDAKLAFAPRISALVPTGSARLGRGVGGAGIQTMMPVS